MAVGFFFAVIAAGCSASAAMLQSIGAGRVSAGRVGPALLWRLVRCPPYAAGLALDGASSGLTFAALRSVPLFAVQAVGASNLGIVAVLTTVVLRVRLHRRDWAAVGAVVAGLVLLIASARTGPPAATASPAGWALLGAVLGLSAAARALGTRLRATALPGLLAGLTFGAGATAARLVGGTAGPLAALVSPAICALILAGLAGTLLYATALQHGPLTTTAALTVVGQTVGPAVIGTLLLGDGVRPGLLPFAISGFVLTVTGAALLARHAHARPRPGPRHCATVSSRPI
jgi:drug/metabolite transporter (DMT)-like permease